MAQVLLCVHFLLTNCYSQYFFPNLSNPVVINMSNIISSMLCSPEITVHTSSFFSFFFLFWKHLFPPLTFNSPRSGSASPVLRSSAQHNVVSKHGFSVSEMTMIQNRIIEVCFYHAEFKIDLYSEDETFFLLNMVLIIEVWGFFWHSHLVSIFWLGYKTLHPEDQLRDSCERKSRRKTVCPHVIHVPTHTLLQFLPIYLSKLSVPLISS